MIGKLLKVFVAMLVCVSSLLLGSSPVLSAEVSESSEPAKNANSALRSAMLWRGADGAMTIRLASGKVLWLFGDTWINTRQKHSLRLKMVNNTVAIQESEYVTPPPGSLDWKSFDTVVMDDSRWSFWFKGSFKKPTSIFIAAEKGSYYWPGCGVKYGDKLFLLLKKIRIKDDPNPLFQFDWYADDILIVSNPDDPPNVWKYVVCNVSRPQHEIQFGLACTADQRYLYSVCFLEEKPNTAKRTILARTPLEKLEYVSSDSWEYYCDSSNIDGAWQADFRNAKNIIPDCGPEVSLFFHKGLKCFVAVYQPPLSPQVKLRVSRKFEGPWSEALNIFTVPERRLKDGKTALTYAAKAHESLSTGNTIGFSYCENPGGIEQHIANPDVYFPTVRTFTIAPEKVREMLDGAGSPKPKP